MDPKKQEHLAQFLVLMKAYGPEICRNMALSFSKNEKDAEAIRKKSNKLSEVMWDMLAEDKKGRTDVAIVATIHLLNNLLKAVDDGSINELVEVTTKNNKYEPSSYS